MNTEAHYTYAMLDLDGELPECFLAQFSDEPCGGLLEKAHLIRQQTIRREVLSRVDDPKAVLWDKRVWRPGCFAHHTALDQSKRLRIPRQSIPAETEQYAQEYGLVWWLARTYGERSVAA